MRRPALELCCSFSIALLLAASLATGARAADPEASCQKATAKSLASCVQQVHKAQLSCFKKTDAACPASDKKRTKALAKLTKAVEGKCTSDALVAAAGYGPLDPAGLATRLGDACAREAEGLTQRLLGEPKMGASAAEAKCLATAAKESGKLLVRSLKTAGKCAGKSCDASDYEKNLAKQEKSEAKAEQKLAKKCPDLEALAGVDPAGLVAETVDRLVGATASSCDPIDEARCMLPFANDYFTVVDPSTPTGRRLALTVEGTPANSLSASVDPAKWNLLDGWSVGPALHTQNVDLDLGMSGAPPLTDLASSLDPASPVVLFDAESGEQLLLFVERDVNAPTPEESAVITRVGTNLHNARRHLVAMRDLRDATGAVLPASPAFAALRDRSGDGRLPIEGRRLHMESLFEALGDQGLARAELQLAWDFTTQSTESTSRKLLAMRDDAFQNRLAGAAPAFTVDQIDEPHTAEIFRRIDGTFQVPLYLEDGGVPGSALRLDEDGLPVNEGDFFTARYRCIVPYAATTAGAAPAVPARVSLYGHGLLGTGNQTSSSHVRDFASEHNFVICGTDWSGFADEDFGFVTQMIGNFSLFPNFIERQHQGVLNFLVLGELLLHPDGFASHAAFQVGGESVLDPSGLFYDGNSQGGILGGVLAAVAQDIERFVLGVPGINYSTLLNRSVDFAPFAIILSQTYPSALDRSMLIALAQVIWDQTDPNGHVRHTIADPYPNTPPKKLLYQVAFGDHQVAPYTVEVAARSNGASIHTPILQPGKVVPELDPYYDIPSIPTYPFDGSAVVIWDSGNPSPPVVNVPPSEITPADPEWADLSLCAQDHDSDPHECPRRQPSARLQKSEFLRNGGAVIDACSGMACLAPAP